LDLGNVFGEIKMRGFVVMCAAALALAGCQKKQETAAATGDAAPAAAKAPAGPLTPPKRKPGLWAHTITSQGATQAMKVCLDADTDAKMSLWGQAVSKDMCSKNTFAAAPGGYAFASECDMAGMGHVSSKGTVTGDFNTAYTVKASSTTTGSSMPQANTTSEMTLTARWEGACPADMKGGDMTLPGGMKINIETVTAAAAKK
jgi:hypothetical protein